MKFIDVLSSLLFLYIFKACLLLGLSEWQEYDLRILAMWLILSI